MEAGLAGGAGLVGAVGAHLGAVALVVGGDVQRGQDGADVGAGEEDGVGFCLPAGCPGCGVRRGRGLVEVGAVGGVAGAFVDVGEVADQRLAWPVCWLSDSW